MNPKLFSITCALTAALLAVAPTARAQSKTVTVKFDILKSGHMSVPVTINGKGPYRVGFDTGSPVTLLSTKIGKQLNLEQGGMGIGGAGMLGMMGMNFGGMGNTQLSVGDALAENVPVIVMDHPTVKLLNSLLGGFEGLVGFSFFSRFHMTIDFQKQEMTFTPVDYTPPDVMQNMTAMLMGGGGLGRGTPRQPLLGVRVVNTEDGTPGALVFQVMDGGAASAAGILQNDRIISINERELKNADDLQVITSTVTPGQTLRFKLVRNAEQIELAVKTRPVPGAAGIAKKVASRSVVLGLAVQNGGEDAPGAVVTSVVPGSVAAAAGLRAGDRVTGMDQRWVTNTRDLYDSVSSLAPAQAAKFVVVRDGKEISVTFTPRAGF